MALYPFVYTISMSLSSAAEAMRASLHLYPRDISLTSYRMVLSNPEIVTGFNQLDSAHGLGHGTDALFYLSDGLSAGAARNAPTAVRCCSWCFFTMLFSGGIVPNYLLVKNLGLIDSIWALVLPADVDGV